MKSLVESITSSMIPEGVLDPDFDQTYEKAYSMTLKNLTKLRDDLVKLIGTWKKLDKDGKGYSTDDWEFHDNEWLDLRIHLLFEFGKLIHKHHLDDVLTTWQGIPTTQHDDLKIININGTRTTHTSLIWLCYDADEDGQTVSVWIEDPKRFLELFGK